MDCYQKALMVAPSIESDGCAICGKYPAEKHHIVFRSQGGTSGPVVPLCGFGNASGHHGMAHQYRLHFRYVTEDESIDGVGYWEYIITDAPIKLYKAMRRDEWERIGKKPRYMKIKAEKGLQEPPI